MKITQLLNRLVNRLLYKTKLIAALGILSLTLLVLAACAPQSTSSLPPIVSTSLAPAETSSQGLTKPTLTPNAALYLRTTPIIIATRSPNDGQHPKNTSTPPSPLTSAENILVALAIEDLSQQLGILLEEIDMVSIEAVTWPDGALGCPQPGVEYIQVQREGSLIRLRVGKTIYQYHSGGGQAPFLCEKPGPVININLTPLSSAQPNTPQPNPSDNK